MAVQLDQQQESALRDICDATGRNEGGRLFMKLRREAILGLSIWRWLRLTKFERWDMERRRSAIVPQDGKVE